MPQALTEEEQALQDAILAEALGAIPEPDYAALPTEVAAPTPDEASVWSALATAEPEPVDAPAAPLAEPVAALPFASAPAEQPAASAQAQASGESWADLRKRFPTLPRLDGTYDYDYEPYDPPDATPEPGGTLAGVTQLTDEELAQRSPGFQAIATPAQRPDIAPVERPDVPTTANLPPGVDQTQYKALLKSQKGADPDVRPTIPGQAPPGKGKAFYERTAAELKAQGRDVEAEEVLKHAAKFGPSAGADEITSSPLLDLSSAAPAPTAAPAAGAPASPWASLARGRGQPAPTGGLPGPPLAEAPDQTGLGIAAMLDLVLNRGRNTGRILGAMSQGGQGVDFENYKRQMAHAKATADLQRARETGDPLKQMLALERLKLARGRETRIAESQGTRQAAAATEVERKDRLRDPGSEETKQARELALQFIGDDDPEMSEWVSNASADQISEWRSQVGQKMAQKSREKFYAGLTQLRHGQRLEVIGVQSEKQKAKEEREVGRKEARTSISGWQRSPGAGVPSDAVHKAAIDITDALGEMEYNARELLALHEELGAMAKLGTLASLTDSETASKIARARILHNDLTTAQRQLANMGVPQQYELELVESVLPQLGTINGILMAGHAYTSVLDEAPKKAARRMSKLGYVPDADAGSFTRTGTGAVIVTPRKRERTPPDANQPPDEVETVEDEAVEDEVFRLQSELDKDENKALWE